MCMADHVNLYLFLVLILAHLLSLSIYLHPQVRMGCQGIDKEKNRDPKKKELHELYTVH